MSKLWPFPQRKADGNTDAGKDAGKDGGRGRGGGRQRESAPAYRAGQQAADVAEHAECRGPEGQSPQTSRATSTISRSFATSSS